MESKEEFAQRKRHEDRYGRKDKYWRMSRRELVNRAIELEDRLRKVSPIDRPSWAEMDDFKEKHL